jgi:hypothetical protein
LSSNEMRQTQQYCPGTDHVVVLKIEGVAKGTLIEGEVVDCNHVCAKDKPFCWKKRHISTSLW